MEQIEINIYVYVYDFVAHFSLIKTRNSGLFITSLISGSCFSHSDF